MSMSTQGAAQVAMRTGSLPSASAIQMDDRSIMYAMRVPSGDRSGCSVSAGAPPIARWPSLPSGRTMRMTLTPSASQTQAIQGSAGCTTCDDGLADG